MKCEFCGAEMQTGEKCEYCGSEMPREQAEYGVKQNGY